MSETTITIRIIEIGGGGFVMAEVHSDGDITPLQAVSTIDEAVGSIQRRVRDWNNETKTLRQRQSQDDQPNVIKPRRFWPQLFSRVEADETGT